MPTSINKKLQNIQALRGVAILLVMIFHLAAIEAKFSNGIPLLSLSFCKFGSSGVDLFFVISGFVMVSVTRGKRDGVKGIYNFLSSRFFRIYPIYWCFTFLVLLIFLVKPQMVNSSSAYPPEILSSFLILPQKGLPLLMVGWSLVHEVYFYLVFAFFLFFSQKHILKLTMGWTALIISALFFPKFANYSPTLEIITNPLTLEFICGVLVAQIYYADKLRLSNPQRLLYLLVILMPVFYLTYDFLAKNYDYSNLARALLLGIPYAMILYISLIWEKQGKTYYSWLSQIGDISYSLYLSHILIYNLLGRIWSYFAHESIIDNLVALPLILITTIIASKFINAYLETPLAKLGHKR